MTPSRGGSDARPHLGEVMGRVARRLQEEHGDVDATLRAVTTAAVATVPHASECSISYVTGRREVESRASTGDLSREVDALQGRLGEGPCLDAVWEEEVVRVDDVAAEQRWPRFAREAAALGAGSMMCSQLFVSGDQLGALNLYSRDPGVFDDEAQEIGMMLAAHAAVAIAGAEHEQNLRRAVDRRDLIGQAEGILMERYEITADQAFGVLARVSQQTNRRLADIARELDDTGTVPGGPQRFD